MVRYSVDRFEGDLAVLVDDEGISRTELLSALPEGTHEGTILLLTEEGYSPDPDTESKRREQVLSLQERLRRKSRN